MPKILKNNNEQIEEIIRQCKICSTDDLQTTILSHYEKMVYKQCRRWRNHNYYEDLVQDCKMSIIQAIGLYDSSRASFSTFVWNKIRGAVTNNVIHYTGFNYYQTKKNPNYIQPTFTQLSDWLSTVDRTELEFTDLLNILDEPNRIIFYERFKLNMTLTQIATQHDCSVEWVRQILKKGCNKLSREININD